VEVKSTDRKRLRQKATTMVRSQNFRDAPRPSDTP